MLVEGKCFGNAMRAHDREAHGVGEAEALVVELAQQSLGGRVDEESTKRSLTDGAWRSLISDELVVARRQIRSLAVAQADEAQRRIVF